MRTEGINQMLKNKCWAKNSLFSHDSASPTINPLTTQLFINQMQRRENINSFFKLNA